MSLRSLITRKLEDAAGAYCPNHFLITLDAQTPFVSGPDDNPAHDNSQLHVFIHEYWHYWHNVSTVSGFKSFAFTQHLLAHFANTLLVRADGTSAGSGCLDASARADVAALLHLERDLDGDGAPDPDWSSDFDLSFSVTAIKEEDGELSYQGGRKAPNPRVVLGVDVAWPDGRTAKGEMTLGSYAIEESIAFLVEEQVRGGLPGVAYAPPPAFPYRVVERVYEHVLGVPAPSPCYPAALGTLALLATHPGPALVAFARMFKEDRVAGFDEEQALSRVVARAQHVLNRAIDTILASDLPELVDMHRGRGLLDGALTHMSRIYRRALELRRQDPLFDLRIVFPRGDAAALLAHQAAFPPCDLLQERAGDVDAVMRDALYSFDLTPEDEYGHRPTDYTRSFQAQQAYLYAHVDDACRFMDSATAASRCPYYSACHLPFRLSHPDVCRAQPWKSYSGAGDACWYSTAVASSLGTVKIKKRLVP